MSGITFPLALSITGHALCLTLSILFLTGKPSPVPEPVAKGGIEVAFQPARPRSETTPLPEPSPQPEIPPPLAEIPPPLAEMPPPEPQAEVVPPAPETPTVLTAPTSPAPEASVAAIEATLPPAPTRKPAVRKPPKPSQRHEELPQPSQAYIPPAQALTAPAAPSQTASAATPVPAPVPSPEASAGYRALLSAWLESHKRYPEASRQRGEEGNAVLRFEVDRNGRILDYAVIKSSGYPDLDESIEQMMRGATLPPFPAGMPQPRMEVSVTIRYSLRR